MKEVEFSQLRTGQYVVVKQIMRGPGARLGATAVWAGKISECNNKWLKVKHNKMESIVAQQGVERFFTLDKKEYETFVKDFDSKDIEI